MWRCLEVLKNFLVILSEKYDGDSGEGGTPMEEDERMWKKCLCCVERKWKRKRVQDLSKLAKVGEIWVIFVWWGSESGRWERVSQKKKNLTNPLKKKFWAITPHLPLISQPHKSHKYLSLSPSWLACEGLLFSSPFHFNTNINTPTSTTLYLSLSLSHWCSCQHLHRCFSGEFATRKTL